METLPAKVSRLPLRVRLVSGFSAAMLLALVAAGSFVYWRVEYALDRGLDTELTQATQSLVPLIKADGSVGDGDDADATGVVWQVLNAHGAVLDHGGSVKAHPLASPRHLTTVQGASRTINIGNMLPISPHPFRVRITQVNKQKGLYLLAAVRRDHRDEALRELLLQLGLAGVAVLVFTALVGDQLARAALTPVERYRRQAAAIADGSPNLRLDVPADRDDEVTRLGHTFNEMLASLARALDRERRFVTEASHELRTPITLLRSRIQLARRRSRSADAYERVLNELEIDVDRLAELAEHLLQVGSAGEVAEPQRSDLGTTIARSVADRDDQGLTVNLPAESTLVALSDFDVERLIANVLDNATTHGSAPVTLTVDRPDPAWARVIVTDAGIGMPADFLGSATQRFARADTARGRPGVGLGLALVEALATRAGGSLRLCHDGQHISFGRQVPLGCTHWPAMTVTVLLPVVSEPR